MEGLAEIAKGDGPCLAPRPDFRSSTERDWRRSSPSAAIISASGGA